MFLLQVMYHTAAQQLEQLILDLSKTLFYILVFAIKFRPKFKIHCSWLQVSLHPGIYLTHFLGNPVVYWHWFNIKFLKFLIWVTSYCKGSTATKCSLPMNNKGSSLLVLKVHWLTFVSKTQTSQPKLNIILSFSLLLFLQINKQNQKLFVPWPSSWAWLWIKQLTILETSGTHAAF